jgi:hypothetical protein
MSKLPLPVRIGDEGWPVASQVRKENVMKQYLLSVCYPAGGSQPPPAELQRIMQDVGALQKEMQSAGIWVFGGGLHAPDTATVVRQEGGRMLTTDGPFIESKEQIGGITILKAPDLDAALAWGGKMAKAIGVPIEVRPFMEGRG